MKGNFSIIGRVGSAERVRYTSYGEPVASPAADLNGDGSVTTTDQTTLLGAFGKSMGQAGYVVEADINRDGSVTTTDLTKLLGQFGNTLGRGTLSADPDWITAYDGYLHEPETGLYCVRNRWYEPNAGRWTSRDPAGYVDGLSLYQYGMSNPSINRDFLGLFCKCRTPWTDTGKKKTVGYIIIFPRKINAIIGQACKVRASIRKQQKCNGCTLFRKIPCSKTKWVATGEFKTYQGIISGGEGGFIRRNARTGKAGPHPVCVIEERSGNFGAGKVLPLGRVVKNWLFG